MQRPRPRPPPHDASRRATPPLPGLDLSPPSAWHELQRAEYVRWLVRATLFEFLGTFVMIYNQAAVGDAMLREGFAVFATADILGHGLAAFVATFCVVHVTGAIFNPALSAGLWISQRIDALTAALFVCAQCAASLAAAAVLYGGLQDVPGLTLGVPQLHPAIALWRGVALEVVWGAILFWFTAAVFLRGRYYWYRGRYTLHGARPISAVQASIAAFGWGACVEACFVSTMGTSPNPARWLGPAVIAGEYANWPVWVVGPFLGVAGAALLYALDAAYLRPNRAFTEQGVALEAAAEQRRRQGSKTARADRPPGLPRLIASTTDLGLP